MQYWLVKTEPETYSFSDLQKKVEDIWDGVRNYQARNFLMEMKKGDLVLVYHSGKDKAIVGLAELSKEHFPDPNQGDDDRWYAVKLKAKQGLKKNISLETIKKTEELQNMLLLKQSRLSVMPVSEMAFETIVKMSSL